MTTDEKKLLQAKHRLEEAEMRARNKERKARTRRLIQEGAILEKVIPSVASMSLDDVEDFLCGLRRYDGVLRTDRLLSEWWWGPSKQL